MQIGVITNPNSRKNRGRAGRAKELQRIVGNLGEVHETPSVESIKPILREFLRKRARFWVADGGDGALHYMLRAGLEVLEEDEFANSDVALPLTMPTNGGTIDFVANNVGLKGGAEQLLHGLRHKLESGRSIEEVEVDAMLIEGIEVKDDGSEESFRTFGFASAAGGVGQRFYSKYYAEEDPNPRTIVKVVANAAASVGLGPLRNMPGVPKHLRTYADDVFRPARARVTIDGTVFPYYDCTAINVASMSINLGNVFRFFGKAEAPGKLHALVAAETPMGILRNIPRMARGAELRGGRLADQQCTSMTMEAIGDELLSPIIDGEYYRNLRKVSFSVGPRVRIPKVTGRKTGN